MLNFFKVFFEGIISEKPTLLKKMIREHSSILRHKRGVWVGSENGNSVGGPKKVKNIMT